MKYAPNSEGNRVAMEVVYELQMTFAGLGLCSPGGWGVQHIWPYKVHMYSLKKTEFLVAHGASVLGCTAQP